MIEQVLGARGAAVRFAVRHFPVRSLHEYAEGAAMAVEAAGRQGKFWEMYRTVMEAPGRVRPVDLECLARRLDLDLDEFHRDLENDELRAKIREQKRGGLRSGVNGTPTLFVNGVRYDGAVCPVREEELREAVAAARREAARTEAG
jgi:protein-disulfide isomerase